MNVSLNTNNLNTFNQYQNKNKFSQKPQSFTGNKLGFILGVAENGGDVAQPVIRESKFFKRFFDNCSKKYDTLSDWTARYITRPLFDNKLTEKFADKLKNTNNLFQHFLAIGSAITSGMYVVKTLKNDDLEKDRKYTLAINQGLTFGVSTVGAYGLDKYLNKWWDGVTVKYAGAKFKNSEFHKDFVKGNNKLKELNKPLIKAKDYIDSNIKKYLFSKEDKDAFNAKISGMGLLKTMIIFALVYRYIVPVAVTPIANKMGENMVAKKKAKEAEMAKQAK